MSKRANRVAAARKQSAIYQTVVGELLGISPDALANYETGRRKPPLEIALSLELLFGISISELFPELREQTLQRLFDRAQRLSIAIEGRKSVRARRTRAFLRLLAERLHNATPAL